MYLKVIKLLSSTNSPIYILLMLLAQPVILLFFGNDWIEAVPILQLLAIGTICISVGNPVGSLQLAKGRADWGFYWNLAKLIFMPATIWGGSFYGLIGVAAALAVFRILTTYMFVWRFFINPLTKSTYIEYIWSFSKPILLSVSAAVLPYYIINSIVPSNIYIELAVGGLLYGITYIVLSFLFNKDLIKEAFSALNISLPHSLFQKLT